MINAENWLSGIRRWHNGQEQLTLLLRAALKLENPSPLLYATPTPRTIAQSKLYVPWQMSTSRLAQLIREYLAIPITDPGWEEAKHIYEGWANSLSTGVNPSLDTLLGVQVNILNELNDAYRWVKKSDAQLIKTILPYFIKEVEDRLSQLADIVLTMNASLTEILDWIKKWGPPILIVGGGFMLLNLMVRLGVKVPAK